MRHMKKAIVVLAFLTACGGGGGWEDAQRDEFIAGCESSGTSNALCKCMQEKVEAAHPDLKDPADLDQTEVAEIAKECAG
jgi:hypothetical protein